MLLIIVILISSYSPNFLLIILFNNSPRVKSKSDDILYGFEKNGFFIFETLSMTSLIFCLYMI